MSSSTTEAYLESKIYDGLFGENSSAKKSHRR